MRNITVIGSANMDTVYSVPRIPAPGETVIASGVIQNPGGKGANQAVAAARAGAEVRFAGAVGHDAAGEALLGSLRGAGVDTACVRISNMPTGSAFINVSPEGENNIVVHKGANDDVDTALVDAALEGMAAGDICVLQIEIPLETVWYAVKRCHERGISVLLNPSPVVQIDPEALRAVDILVPNEHEMAELLGGAPDEAALAEYCRTTGVKRVIMTMGSHGVWDVTADEFRFYPCSAVKAVDSTGAGDCFLGTLAASLARGGNVDTAIQYAMAASAIAVTRMGAQQGMPTDEEIERALKNRK